VLLLSTLKISIVSVINGCGTSVIFLPGNSLLS